MIIKDGDLMTEATPTQCYPRQSDVRGMGSDPNADSTASHATLPNGRRINFESQQIRKERTFYHAVTYDDIDKGNGPSVELQNLTKKVSTRSANGGVFNHLPILPLSVGHSAGWTWGWSIHVPPHSGILWMENYTALSFI